jgi:hypothetical protein
MNLMLEEDNILVREALTENQLYLKLYMVKN